MDVPLAPKFRDLVKQLENAAPNLCGQIAPVVSGWLGVLIQRLGEGELPRESKIFNDPVWGSIILQPAEVLLLDTPLLQRLRGVRQLGMAHYVFPGAVYDRLEHVRGVVEGAQRIITALDTSVARQKAAAVPGREGSDVEAIRLAALLHDIGHGPFSHATEDLVAARYATEVQAARIVLFDHYDDVLKAAAAELLAILMIVSPSSLKVLTHPRFPVSEREHLPAIIVGSLLGSAKYLSAPYLAGVVSGPIDADKLDYMARDSHHAGLTLGLETARLLTQLQVATVTPANAPNRELRERAEESKDRRYYDLSISRAGIGAYEQMIVGRAILYDRVYYHHKVRTAEAMVRRLIEITEVDGGLKYDLAKLMPPLTDETFVCILGGLVTRQGYPQAKDRSQQLGAAILYRDLYHRAFAFSTRFLAGLDTLDEQERNDTRTLIGRQIQRIAADPEVARSLERKIADRSRMIARTLKGKYLISNTITAEEIIVDLPQPDRVTVRGQDILVSAADGHLEIPNLYFDPEKWAQAYRVNKLCGFVFCQRNHIPTVNLAAKIVFAEDRGVVVNTAADRLVKASNLHNTDVWDRLLAADVLTLDTAERLRRRETRFADIQADSLILPVEWAKDGSSMAEELAHKLRTTRPRGFTKSQHDLLIKLIEGLTSFYVVAYAGGLLREVKIGQESELQNSLRNHLRSRGYNVTEAQKIAGGQEDLLFNGQITIENKIYPVQTDIPLEVGKDYPYQARRYSIPASSEIVATVVGYKPKSETGHFMGKDCIEIRLLEDARTIEIRLVVPVDYSTPSKAKAP